MLRRGSAAAHGLGVCELTCVHLRAGLDSARAGDLYRRVERQLQVALPPPSRQQTFTLDFLAAAEATGLPIDDDPLSRTGPAADGIWITPIATDSAGRRQDSCTAYLSPVTREGGACATRLRLIQSATVSRVVVEGGRAVGVQYIKTDAPEGKQLRRITAKKEVILSAGPYGSPQVLQLSGIGRPHVVGALGVHPVMDLPVGEDTLVRRPLHHSRPPTLRVAIHRERAMGVREAACCRRGVSEKHVQFWV